MDSEREAPTADELLRFAATLPASERTKLLAKARPAPPAPAPVSDRAIPLPDPMYRSWGDYLTATTEPERQAWCYLKARKANQPRLMSGKPIRRVTAADVWDVLEKAAGQCVHCGSLAVERRPTGARGAPLPWEPVGRRIGSLGHALARFNGGDNDRANLVWSCLWCNTWTSERRPGATDHGGIQ